MDLFAWDLSEAQPHVCVIALSALSLVIGQIGKVSCLPFYHFHELKGVKSVSQGA